MNQYLPEDIARLLKATDELLEQEFHLIVIGGAAASLAYGATKATTDIDLANDPPEEMLSAIERARELVGVQIPMQYVGLFEPPYSYEERLVSMRKPKLSKLHVYFPERHDLALMKMVRGYENDLQTIEEIHQAEPLDLEILLERFMKEMTQVNSNPMVVRTNFMLLTQRLFGSSTMEQIEAATESWFPLRSFSR